jgi:hypothetical protein
VNPCNIRVKVLKSCKMQYDVAGDSFYVKVSNLIFQGWTICSLCCRDIHRGVVGPSPLLSFGDMLWNVVCAHEGSTGESCSHRIDLR